MESWKRSVRSHIGWRPAYGLVCFVVIALAFVPLWRDREDAYFVIEPSELRAICAAVPGKVSAVLVHEGERVHEGQPLLKITSNTAEAMRSSATADTDASRFKAFNAQLAGQSIGTAMADQLAAQKMRQLANEAHATLDVMAPGDGTILTENPALLEAEDVGSGQALLRLAEGPGKVRVFIPTTALNRISPNAEVALAVPGRFRVLRLRLGPIEEDPVALPGGLVETQKYKGLKLPVFYTSVISLPGTSGDPMYGLSGHAVAFGIRRSIADRIARAIVEIVKAHIWW